MTGCGPRARKLGDDLRRAIGRVVVDHEDFELVGRKCLSRDAGQRLPQQLGAVVGANGDSEAHGVARWDSGLWPR